MTALQGWIVIGLLVLIMQILDLSDELDQADQQKNRERAPQAASWSRTT